MESDLKIQEILNSKNEVLDKILSNLKSWDGEIESGIALIETNQNYLDELMDLNEKLSKSPITSTYDKEYEYKLNLIMEEQKGLTLSLRDKQNDIKENIRQISKKEKVINNYINRENKPLFINKQLF